jgi:Asp-tRNA(Asn)/Glu-tRNA(Gln) amidotransferase A subunit family amidase
MSEVEFDLSDWHFWAVISSFPLFYLYSKLGTRLERMYTLLAKARTQHQSVDIALSSSVSYPEIPPAQAAKISKATICELIAMRDAGEITCEEMVLTCVRNARVLGRQFNVVAYEHIHEAVTLARKYDQLIANKEPHGPLLGIPFSVKDCIATKSSPFTYGCASMANNTQFEDANVIRVLKEAGAILLFKGSMGMLGASSETENRMVGRAANPWDITRTPGGSSGGDAVLVSTRSVPFGTGTDIGGSLRYPAAYCGLYTLKPTAQRLSSMAPIIKSGFPPLFTSWGFMTRSVEDLAMLYSIEFGDNLFSADPLMPPIHWREDRYTSTTKLKIGYVLDNDYWPVADCCKRAVTETVTALQAQGHELVKFELFALEEMMELSWKVMMASKDGPLRLKEELPLWSFRHIAWRRLMPSPFIALCYHLKLKGKESMMWKALYETTLQDMIISNIDAETIRNKYFQAMQTQGIDAIIVPYPFPAFPHGLTPRNTYSAVWTMLFNLLDMPVGSVPVGIVRENEQFYHKGEDEYVKSTSEVMKGAAGLPISVQVVTRRYQDELCLNIMRQIAKEIPFAEAPPGVEALINA